MGNDESAVRPLVASDLDWVVDLATRCGEQRQSFAPRFWRRAPDARQVHTRYLRSLIEDPSVPAMRTEHAFAIGMCRPGLLLVDDAAAEGADHWGVEGVTLLTRLAAGSHLRFVCPVPEPGRAALAARLRLTCVETWWHRDLPHRSTRSPGQESRRVRLVPAPPIYAPGGPVLLVTGFRGRRALAEMEEEAAASGATVSVVTQAPGDSVREELLSSAGYRRTCDFYEGLGKACVTRT